MSDHRVKAGPVARPTVGMAPAVVRLARLRPERVRVIRFRRTRVGRRGLVEEQVYAFVRRVVDELIARDAAEDGLRKENARLKQALRDWQSQQAGSRRH